MSKIVKTKLLPTYKACDRCHKVLVKRTYIGFEFKPICQQCRHELRNNTYRLYEVEV